MGLYILGALLLASIVFAFLSARTWHWGHVLVVLGIVLSTIGFFILAAETLRINKALRTQVNNLQRDLDNVNARNDALRKGTTDQSIIAQMQAEDPPLVAPENAESIPSLAELDHELLIAMRMRGRVWDNVAPAKVDPTGAVSVSIEAPVPAGLRADTVVYVFEQGPAELPTDDGTPRGKQYLGEFRVSEATAQTATLLPVLPLDPFEQNRLAKSPGPWIIYETMPADRHAIFAGMTEDELKQKLPKQSVNEYLRHGKEAGPDDPEERQIGLDADGKLLPPDQLGQAAKKLYQRRLRDYATEFDTLVQRRIVMLADAAAVLADIERLKATQASANELQAFRKQEVVRLTKDLQGMKAERAAIEAHLAQVQQQLANARKLLADTLRRNDEMAAELAGGQGPVLGPAGGARAPAAPVVPLALGSAN